MNGDRMKFGLMWANHDWINIHPSGPVYPTEVLGRGMVSREAFERLTDHAVAEYFSKPNYWRIDGAPYFSIYEVDTFIRGMGGMDSLTGAAAVGGGPHRGRGPIGGGSAGAEL